jgi:NAD(P)H-hydrate epimerase
MSNIELPTLAARAADSHKGDYGKVLVIAGSETMIGAPALTGLAALRSGAGLVRLALPKDIIPAVLTVCPYATAFAWQGTRLREIMDFAEEHDVLAVGPGLGVSAATRRLLIELLERHPGPLVLDADALNTIASLEVSDWPKRRDWSNVVLTPHMGEYMRLMSAVMKRATPLSQKDGGAAEDKDEQAPAAPVSSRRTRSLVEDPDEAPCTADGVALELPPEVKAVPEALAAEAAPQQPDRTPLAELLAQGTGCIVVLKGHRTIVADGQRSYVNTTGNPAMATAGSGDVLTGVIAALIGQRLSPRDAAVLGVHVHGRAGDLAREAVGSVGLLAMDIINQLPRALSEHIAG